MSGLDGRPTLFRNLTYHRCPACYGSFCTLIEVVNWSCTHKIKLEMGVRIDTTREDVSTPGIDDPSTTGDD